MDDRKKKLVSYVVIGVCLLGAGVMYFVLSDNEPKQTPKLRAAESNANAIQQSIIDEQKKQPAPPEAPAPPPRKGSVQIKH